MIKQGENYIKASHFFLLYIVIWTISPPLYANDIARVIALFCMLTILITELLKKKIAYKYLLVLLLYLLFTCILGITILGFSYIKINIQQYIVLYMAFICINNMDNIKHGIDRYNLDKIVTVILFIYPIWMINTIIAYAMDPYISRELAGNGLADEYYWSMKGVGGYGMIYSLVFYNIALLYMLIFHKKLMFKYKNVLILFNYGLSLFTILKAGYSIAIIATMFGTIIIILIKNNHLLNTLVILFIIFMLAILIFTFQDSIVQFILTISKSTLYENKVKDIIYSIKSGNTLGTLNNRFIRYQYSMNAFKIHFIFGTSIHGDLINGGHSLILDTLSKSGLMGGIQLLYLILYYPVSCIKNNKAFSLSIAMLTVIIFIGTTNTIAAAMGPMLYILYPSIVNKERILKDNNSILK